MKQLKHIMQEYGVEKLLEVKIVQLLAKDKLTKKQEALLDLMIDTVLKVKYNL